MWPFRRRQANPVDRAIDEAIQWTSGRWSAFGDEAGLPPNLTLRDSIAFFARSMRGDMARTFPTLAAADDQIVLLIIAKAIEQSGTHSRRQIEGQLGIVLPP